MVLFVEFLASQSHHYTESHCCPSQLGTSGTAQPVAYLYSHWESPPAHDVVCDSRSYASVFQAGQSPDHFHCSPANLSHSRPANGDHPGHSYCSLASSSLSHPSKPDRLAQTHSPETVACSHPSNSTLLRIARSNDTLILHLVQPDLGLLPLLHNLQNDYRHLEALVLGFRLWSSGVLDWKSECHDYRCGLATTYSPSSRHRAVDCGKGW